MTRTIATLFSGGGGFDLGALAAGYAHLWGVEFDAQIAAVAEANGLRTIAADVRAVDYAALERPSHLHASPVCKNASVAKSGSGPADWQHWMTCQRAARKRYPNGLIILREIKGKVRRVRVEWSRIGHDWYETSGGTYRQDGIGEYPEDLHTAQAVCRAIVALQPTVFTLENVRGYQRFAAYAAILDTLRAQGYGIAADVLNAADYGVPQTRERLILRAVLGQDRPALPVATHARADRLAPMFDDRRAWVGWYEAIADLVPMLPDSAFAPWQLARLPGEIRESVLIPEQNAGRDPDMFPAHRPAMTLTTYTVKHPAPRAFILDCQDSGAAAGLTLRDGEAPCFTVTAGKGGRQPARAFLVNGTSDMGIQDIDSPAQTVVATVGSKAAVPRAAVAGRVVRMTPRALARFQSFPDSYTLPSKAALATTIIGNAVPPLLAQRICEVPL